MVWKVKLTPDLMHYARLHGGVKIDDDRVWFPLRCTALDQNGKCRIYSKRPDLCRQYPLVGDWTPENCNLKIKEI